jgi:hypothetical protein
VKRIDISGLRFHWLSVVEFSHISKSRSAFWLCLCDCGKQSIVSGSALRSGSTKSCGCLRIKRKANFRHGFAAKGSEAPEYRIWRGIKTRTTNRRRDDYRYYGGRGIKMCPEWFNSFPDFLRDVGERPSPDHTIERKNNSGDYCATNCVWATRMEQGSNSGKNKRILRDELSLTYSQWERKLGLKPSSISCRIYRGASPEEALDWLIKKYRTAEVTA